MTDTGKRLCIAAMLLALGACGHLGAEQRADGDVRLAKGAWGAPVYDAKGVADPMGLGFAFF